MEVMDSLEVTITLNLIVSIKLQTKKLGALEFLRTCRHLKTNYLVKDSLSELLPTVANMPSKKAAIQPR
jgi:hypothetical protein